jgi:hypothetical protein
MTVRPPACLPTCLTGHQYVTLMNNLSNFAQICHINDFTSEQLKVEQQRYDESRTIAQVSCIDQRESS